MSKVAGLKDYNLIRGRLIDLEWDQNIECISDCDPNPLCGQFKIDESKYRLTTDDERQYTVLSSARIDLSEIPQGPDVCLSGSIYTPKEIFDKYYDVTDFRYRKFCGVIDRKLVGGSKDDLVVRVKSFLSVEGSLMTIFSSSGFDIDSLQKGQNVCFSGNLKVVDHVQSIDVSGMFEK